MYKKINITDMHIEVPICDCGGEFVFNRFSTGTIPPHLIYKCEKCGCETYDISEKGKLIITDENGCKYESELFQLEKGEN